MNVANTAHLRRTVLASPGSNERMLTRAATTDADAVFLDLEDACAPAEKPAARATVIDALRRHDWTGKTVSVRINDVRGPFGLMDLVEVVGGAGAVLDTVIVPKVRDTGDVAFVERVLQALELQYTLTPGQIGIECQIEDAMGLINCERIAASSDRIETLVFGPADFSAAMHMTNLDASDLHPDYPGDVFHHARMRLAVAARAAGVQVIDGPWTRLDDLRGFSDAAARSAALGFDGKWVVHPSQIERGNAAFTPSRAAYQRAVEIVSAYQTASSSGRGAIRYGAEMVDEASHKLALSVCARGDAAGLKPSTATKAH